MDHCTRLCHASSVAALFEGIGSGAVSTTYGDVINADVAIVTGTNPTANHPVASSFFKQARRNGTTIIYVDPRADKMADHADIFCQLKPGTDVAFYNGVMHEVIRLGLTDAEFIAHRTSNYEALAADRRRLPAGAGRADHRRARRRDPPGGPGLGRGRRRDHLLGHGHLPAHHRHRQRALPDRDVRDHRQRRPAGQRPAPAARAEQRAGRLGHGPDPDVLPGLQEGRRPGRSGPRFEQAWGTSDLDPKRGLTVTEIIGSALKGGVRGMYMLGENPFLSDPNINKVRKALAALEFLVVQDIFLTETAEFADVILPASSYLEKDGTYTNTDRRVQLGRKVLDPPGQARVDWEVVQDIANRIGLGWNYTSAQDVFEEIVSVMASYSNLTYDNLGLTGKLYPNPDPEHSDGTVVMFGEKFNTDDGLAHLVPAEWLPAKELPSDEYPFVLNTGRLLQHWHTGSMTRRSYALDAIAPQAEVYLQPGRRRRARHRRRRDGPGELAPRDHRAGGPRLAPRGPRQLLHPVPLPRGGGQPADHRRDRPGRQDPRVQVLRGADRGRPTARRADGPGQPRSAGRPVVATARGALPGVEARAGKFPGPSLIPALNAIQERVGWLPREELVALARDVRRPLYEIEGLISFYPHFRTDPPKRVALHVCRDLSCWLHGADERIAALRGSGTAQDTDVELVEVSCLGRCDAAPAVSVNERPAAAADAERPDRRSRARPDGRGLRQRRALRSYAGGQPWPNDPYPSAAERYGRAARRAGRRAGHRARSSRRCRTPGCAGWAAPASPPAGSGNWSRRRRPRRST